MLPVRLLRTSRSQHPAPTESAFSLIIADDHRLFRLAGWQADRQVSILRAFGRGVQRVHRFVDLVALERWVQ